MGKVKDSRPEAIDFSKLQTGCKKTNVGLKRRGSDAAYIKKLMGGKYEVSKMRNT